MEKLLVIPKTWNYIVEYGTLRRKHLFRNSLPKTWNGHIFYKNHYFSEFILLAKLWCAQFKIRLYVKN